MKMIKKRSCKLTIMTAIFLLLFVMTVSGIVIYKKLSTSSGGTPGVIGDQSSTNKLFTQNERQETPATHGQDRPAAPGDVDTTEKPKIRVVIDNIEQTSSALVVSTNVYTTESGRCILEATRDDYAPVSKSVDISSNPFRTYCRDTELPLSSLSKGDWSVTIKVMSGSNVATATKSFTVK